MKIAIIGTGISGNVAAYHLSEHHQITVFEKNDYIGGHTHSHDVEIDGKSVCVDSGFIVFNDRTYPKFNALLKRLGVIAQKTEMSFSVKCDVSGLEYKGSGLNAMFAQRRNILNPRFYKLIYDIIRFNKAAKKFIQQPPKESLTDESLNEFLARHGFSDYFSSHYLLPMGAAIWSTDPVLMRDFPAKFFLRFFENHGLLDLTNRPQWYVVPGGSKQYITPLIARFKNAIKLNAEITSVRRADSGVYVRVQGEEEQFFDALFIAAHSDQALAMLSDASDQEEAVLGSIEYQKNEAVLHTDESVLPKRRRAWSAWNYHLGKSIDDSQADTAPVALSYNMNVLQSLDMQQTLCVTLNNSLAIDPSKVIKSLLYHHPIFTPDSVAAQARHGEINGPLNTYFCGAYWGSGFHEDGVVSALNALEHFNKANASAG